MLALSAFVSFLLLFTAARVDASPVRRTSIHFQFPPVNTNRLLCKIPVIRQILCPRGGSNPLNVQTPIGQASGTLDVDGAIRFSVKYASAARWQPSTQVNTWAFPNGATNVTALPLACPQPGADPSSFSEDCLSMILYVPPNLATYAKVPVLMWVHGGSFIVGSANGPGLDGSKLAIATNSIVAVVQYRLGALGFMAPNGATNLAVKDLVTAIQFLRKVAPSFGGSTKITLSGQSSGANMIRALLAVPSASSLFQSAILHSDPMNYGFLKNSVQQALQSSYNQLINCGSSDTACWNALSLSTIVNTQMNLFGNAINIDPSCGMAQPIRPVNDGSFITSPLDSTGTFPNQNKPIMVSTVLNEAAPTIYGWFTDPIPQSDYPGNVAASLGNDRANTLLASSFYVPAPAASDGSTDVRPQLTNMGTDQIWRCASWAFARNWAQHGGSAYVSVYAVGATYPSNNGIDFCGQPGSVCHEDDIQIVFGTVPSPTPAQSSLITEVQKRYKAFLNGGNPNAAGLASWSAVSSSNINGRSLGGSSVDVGACVPTFWGDSVPFDYQIFNA
ncbi:hypothetical protein HGRIS_012985 [Hohenbuehelia grisea]|uniref:Carboxylesterase type B domain-containing protein n=1 Tax=Hohenbuehelia grisea TaxID=104357 RepID=A0ABR3ITZ1_9AGAR